MSIAVGDKRLNGSVSFTVVKVDKKNVYVKRSDDKSGSSYPVTREEFAGWTKA